MESSSNRISLLLEANLRFLSVSLQQNAIILNTLDNSNALDEHQTLLNNLLNWLKSLDKIDGLTQSEKFLIEGLKDSVRKAKSIDIKKDYKKDSFIESEILSSIQATQINDVKENIFPPETIGIEKELSSNEQTEEIVNKNQQISEENAESLANIEEEEQDKSSFFYRMVLEDDRWEYLSSIRNFISSYEHLMHLLMPNLVLEVVNELHRYDSRNKLVINEAISYPSVLLQNLITKFLREAPGSNLFRRIRRIKLENEIDINFEQNANIGERKSIKVFVGNYFEILTKFLNPENPVGIERFEESIKANFKQFSLGPASVEMRLTAVIKHVTESAFNDAEQAFRNDNASLRTKIIYLATTQLMCDFQNFLLNEPRIIKFLEDLKS